MAKLTPKYEYRKDGTKNIKGYLISLPKLELEKNGFNANSEISFEVKENKIIIKKEENKMTKKEILNLNAEELEKNMSTKEFERMQELGLETWQLLDALQDSARLGGQDKNEEHITISSYLDYLEDLK